MLEQEWGEVVLRLLLIENRDRITHFSSLCQNWPCSNNWSALLLVVLEAKEISSKVCWGRKEISKSKSHTGFIGEKEKKKKEKQQHQARVLIKISFCEQSFLKLNDFKFNDMFYFNQFWKHYKHNSFKDNFCVALIIDFWNLK